MAKSSQKYWKDLNVLMLNNGFKLARETKHLIREIKHLNIFKKGFFPQLKEFSTDLCTLSNKNPQQVASDNYYLT